MRLPDRIRGPLSVALIVATALFALTGGVALYLREAIVDSNAFAGRAVNALDRQPVRRVVAREIVVQLIDKGSTDLISARPVLESATEFVVGSDPFKRVFRTAAVNGHRLLFVREGGNVAFDIADAGTIVVPALRSVSPQVARQIPKDSEARLLALRKRSFATTTLRFADNIRVLGIVLPLLALLMLAGAVAVAPNRRAAVTRAGIAIGAAAALLVIALALVKAYLLAHVYGTDELTNQDVRGATRGIWDAFLGDLSTWAIAVGGFALVVSAASASLLQPFEAERGMARLRALARPPESTGWRVVRGIALIGLGIFIVLEPSLALQIVAVIAGALLLYYGTGELLSAINPSRPAAQQAAERAGRRRTLVVAGIAGAVVIAAGIVAILAVGGESRRSKKVAAVRTCNGYVQLCNRRLDQVVFAGAHNAMSAADSPGWLLVNQRRKISRQLKDGIRLFLIDPHYGVQDGKGKVRTDFKAERRNLNRVSSQLSPTALNAAERLGGRLGLGHLKGGSREIWLCHSVCELGATRMLDALRSLKHFLDRNPGEVVILFDEDYVTEKDLDSTYRRAGLLPHLATLNRDEPLPTLRQLIKKDKRVIVFTEREPSGKYPWNLNGFSFVQDTPLGATKPGQFSCKLNRGDRDSPLLAINNWIDRFPPPLGANRAVLRKDFIVRRARRCERKRGMVPNLIATDFYDQGGLVDAARILNRLRNRKPAPAR